MAEAARLISLLAIPLFIVIILGYGFYKGVPVYETFVEGAKEGLTTAFRILPYMVAMFVAIGIFRTSGAMELLTGLLSPVTRSFGLPAEVVPLALMRPMSGTASLGILAEIYRNYGPDSFVGRLSSTMMGSTETIFYTLSVYFGSVGIHRIKYTLWAALTADLAGMTASLIVCSLVFGR